jgi:predicted ATPase
MLTAGRSTRAIADALYISPRTVEVHIAAIFEKLGVHSRIELAAAMRASDWAQQNEANNGNVPTWKTPLIGRLPDISALTELVAGNRLVTITGPGGIGKTQVSLHVAAAVERTFPDGAWLIELAPLVNGEFLVAEVARALRVTLSPSADALAAVVEHLRQKRALLIFDNCEHIIVPVASTVATLLRDCGSLTILASSREPIGISGERTYRLPQLPVSDAVELFVERALAVDNRFDSTTDNASVIAEICRKLDGIPLAIELAAARTTIFTPSQLLARLERRFTVLDGGRQDAPSRHKNILALIGWSYDLLEDRERKLFRRLSAFAGSFSLEGALAVSEISQANEAELLEQMSSLIDKSIVSVDHQNETLRFRLLESTRAYGREKLEQCGETRAVASLHLRYLRDAFSSTVDRESRTALPVFESAFNDNLGDIRLALETALERGDIVGGAELLATLGPTWHTSSLREGLEKNERFIRALGETEPVLRARMSVTVGDLLMQMGERGRATGALETAVRIAREAGDEPTLGFALVNLGQFLIAPGSLDEAEATLSECESLTNVDTTVHYERRTLRAQLTLAKGDFAEYEKLVRELIEEDRRLGFSFDEGFNLFTLARGVFLAGRPQAAVDLARRAIPLLQNRGKSSIAPFATRELASYLAVTGDYADALETAAGALELFAAIDARGVHAALVIEIVALVAALQDDLPLAATLRGYVANLLLGHAGFKYRFINLDVHARLEAVLGERLAGNELQALSERGAILSAHEAIALAKSRRLEP